MHELSNTTRRSLLKGALALGAAAAASCTKGDGEERRAPPPGAPGAAPAPKLTPATTPELDELRLGIIALTDCAPLVVAHERGLFAKYGLRTTLTKGASWAAIRDGLTNGDLHGTHMLFGMPIASSLGLLGAPKTPMVIPWMLNRNGQAITLKRELSGKVADDPKALLPFVHEAQKRGDPMRFAITFPPGTHAMWMRYFLAAGGVHPDKDIALLTIPPAQMVANMKVGRMDGFCVGEPWGARAIADKIGFTAITTQQIWKDHPEKVLAFTAAFADQYPKTVKAALKAVHEASVWLDELGNRDELATMLSKAAYVNCEKDIIAGRLQGHYVYGDGRQLEDPNYMIFSKRNCNYPQEKHAKWWLTQLRRWGMVEGAPDYEGVARAVLRPALYEEAMAEIGYGHGGRDDDPETLFDGRTFDPATPEQYARSFDIHSVRV